MPLQKFTKNASVSTLINTKMDLFDNFTYRHHFLDWGTYNVYSPRIFIISKKKKNILMYYTRNIRNIFKTHLFTN